MANELADDVQRFKALHHRVAELSDDERAQYEHLRARVQQQLRAPPSESTPVEVPDEDEPLF